MHTYIHMYNKQLHIIPIYNDIKKKSEHTNKGCSLPLPPHSIPPSGVNSLWINRHVGHNILDINS